MVTSFFLLYLYSQNDLVTYKSIHSELVEYAIICKITKTRKEQPTCDKIKINQQVKIMS